jgi:hypothetical protein
VACDLVRFRPDHGQFSSDSRKPDCVITSDLPTTRPEPGGFLPPASGTRTKLFTSARSNVFYRVHSLNPPLLRLVPASYARPPSVHVPAILFVVCPEFAAQSGLFIKENEQTPGTLSIEYLADKTRSLHSEPGRERERDVTPITLSSFGQRAHERISWLYQLRCGIPA